MDIKAKKILSIITYYTLIALTFILAGAFVLALAFRTYPFWAKLIYFVWAGVLVGTVIFDIICTSTNRMKFVSGLLVYVLSVGAIAVSIILYLINTTRTGLAFDFSPVFILITALSYATSLFMIAEYVVGEAIIEHETTVKVVRQRGIKE